MENEKVKLKELLSDFKDKIILINNELMDISVIENNTDIEIKDNEKYKRWIFFTTRTVLLLGLMFFSFVTQNEVLPMYVVMYTFFLIISKFKFPRLFFLVNKPLQLWDLIISKIPGISSIFDKIDCNSKEIVKNAEIKIEMHNKKIENLVAELQKLDLKIHQKYWSEYAIVKIYEYIDTDRADTLKEAINIFEQEEKINQHNEELKEQLKQGFGQLTHDNQRLQGQLKYNNVMNTIQVFHNLMKK